MTGPRYQDLNAMAVQQKNFCPSFGVVLTVGTTSAPMTVPFTPTSAIQNTMELYNAGPDDCFIGWGVAAQGTVVAVVPSTTPALNCKAVPVGAIFTHDFISPTGKGVVDTIAAICATGTANLYICQGSGT